jgi:type 1 glutamine amidotransferase
VWVSETAADHPIVRGVTTAPLTVPSWLYKSRPLKQGAETLMMGRVGEREPREPVAWTYVRPDGGRVFYTSLGHPDDFKLKDVERMLLQAIYWAVGSSS